MASRRLRRQTPRVNPALASPAPDKESPTRSVLFETRDRRVLEALRHELFCLTSGCAFARSPATAAEEEVWTCAAHRVAHVCSVRACEETLACVASLLSAAHLLNEQHQRYACVVSKKTVLSNVSYGEGIVSAGSANCVVVHGLKQKHREALFYDSGAHHHGHRGGPPLGGHGGGGGGGNSSWISFARNSLTARSELSKSHIMNLIAKFVHVVSSFFIFINGEDFHTVYAALDRAPPPTDEPADDLYNADSLNYHWWELDFTMANVEGLHTDEFCAHVLRQAHKVLRFFIAFAHSRHAEYLLGVYRKTEADKLCHLVVIPMLCAIRILDVLPHLDSWKLTKLFFRKENGLFHQYTYTAIDKLMHAAYRHQHERLTDFAFEEQRMHVQQLIVAIREKCGNDSSTWTALPGRSPAPARTDSAAGGPASGGCAARRPRWH